MPAPPAVRVRDAVGNPVPGQPVFFAVTRGEGRVDRDAVLTDERGMAALDHWITGGTVGLNIVAARLRDDDVHEVLFRANTRAGPPAVVTASLPSLLEGPVGQALPVSLAVFIRDRFGNNVNGVTVRFRIVEGGGTLQLSQSSTNSAGRATAGQWVLGTRAGTHIAEATIDGLDPLVIHATALPGAPRPAELLAGPTPVGEAGQVLVDPVTLSFQDAFENPISELIVTTRVTSGGGTVSPAIGVTDGMGRFVLSRWTLGTGTGANAIQVTAPGVAPLVVQMTATPAAPDRLALVAGHGQAAAPNAVLPTAPAVRVEDRFGNPIPDRAVTFAIVDGGGSIGGASAVSDASGLARAGPWQLGGVGGVHTLEARLDGPDGVPPFRFEAEAVTGTPLVARITSGADQSHHAGYPLPQPPVVLVTDAGGDPAPGVEVFFDVLAGGGEVQPRETVTDASGIARIASWRLGSEPGSNRLLVRARGGDAIVVGADGEPPFHVSVAAVHLNQGNQSVTGGAVAVAGREGVLRIFPVATLANAASAPALVRFFHGSAQVLEVIAQPASTGIPTSANVAMVAGSMNVPIPASLVRPGLGVRVEVDPFGSLGVPDRTRLVFPSPGGIHPIAVTELPTFPVTFVPVTSTDLGSTGRVTTSNAEDYLRNTRLMLPVSDVSVQVRQPYTSSATPFSGTNAQNGWILLVQEIQALRTAEGSSRYYHGILRKTVSDGPLGIAYRPPEPASQLRSALSHDDLPVAATTIAHEFGHSFGQRHAPCGGAAGVEPSYPYKDAILGTPGWDAEIGQLREAGAHRDLMSYCNPAWISDFMYGRMLDWRVQVAGVGAASVGPSFVAALGAGSASGSAGGSTSGSSTDAKDGILLWGGWSRRGPELNPVFHLHTRPSPLPASGEAEITGYDAEGRVLFRTPVAGDELADVDDGTLRHFSLFLPLAEPERSALARVELVTPFGVLDRRLSGSGTSAAFATAASAPGRIRIEWDAAAYPIVLVRDAATGAILSFARNGVVEIPEPPSGAVDVQMGEGVRVRTVRLGFR